MGGLLQCISKKCHPSTQHSLFLLRLLFILVATISILICTAILVVSRWGSLLRLGSQGTIWQLVLCEILAHLVESVDGPESQFGYLNPAVVHSFSVHNDYYQMEAIFFKRGC